MGNVIEFRLRPAVAEAPLTIEDFARQATEHFAALRAVVGGDATWDERWGRCVAVALEQFVAAPHPAHAVEFPPDLTQAQIDALLAALRGVLDEQIRRDRTYAVLVVKDAMTALALEATGAELPPGFPFYPPAS